MEENKSLKGVKIVDTKINKKRNNFIRILMILSVLSLVGFYTINKYYLRPHRYKEKMMQEFNSNPNLTKYSEESKISCIDCFYKGLKKKYGDVTKFPGESTNAVVDLEYYKIVISCYANNLYFGSDRDFALSNLDSLAKVLFINDVNRAC